MLRYATLMTFPDQQMMAVEVSYVTHVTVEQIDGFDVCSLHAGPRLIAAVRAPLDELLDALRNAS